MPNPNLIVFFVSAAIAVQAAPARSDEADAFNFFVGYSTLRDDNVFRLRDGANVLGLRADTQTTGSLGGRFDQSYGRQRIKADVSIDRVRYAHFDFLDYNGVAARAAWMWQLGERWTGEVSSERRRVLSDFADLQFAPAQQPEGNLATTLRNRFDANYWFHPDWSLLGAISSTRVNNSAAFRQSSNFDGNSGEVGVLYRRASGNEIGLRYRLSNGRYPNRVLVASSVVDNSYSQDDLEANALWLLSGHSRLTLRGGWTRRNHDDLPQRDFRGLTGRLVYDWVVDGKSALSLTLRRELSGFDAADATYSDVHGLSLAPSWSPTAKTNLRGRIEYRTVAYRGDPGIVVSNAPQRRDRIEALGLTGSYAPWRFLQLSLTVQTERRKSSNPLLPYRDNLGYFSAQFSF